MTGLREHLRETARSAPDRVAVQCKDSRLRYEDLEEALEALDSRPGRLAGTRALVLLPDGIASYLCHLHFFVSSAVATPMSAQASTAQIQKVCERLKPHWIVTNDALRARHRAAFEGGAACVTVRPVESEASWRPVADALSGLRAGGGDARDGRDVGGLRLIVFTSGSTGEPKGVCLSESNLLAAARMNVASLGLDETRRSLVTTPLYDYYGFIQLYSHLLARTGYTLGETAAFCGELFRRMEENVTDLVAVPFSIRELLRQAKPEQLEKFRRFKYVTSSSDALSPEILDRVFDAHPNVKVVNIYGLTEAGRASFRFLEASSPRTRSIGRPASGVKIWIDTAEGEPGEAVIEGPNVMEGYFERIEEDQIVFHPCGGRARTGDAAVYGEDGEIHLIGRRDHLLNVHGRKIHPAEIEQVALEIPGVREARASGRPGPDGGVEICLEVTPENGALDIESLKAHLRRNLPPTFLPKSIATVDRMERTELGSKMIRRKAAA